MRVTYRECFYMLDTFTTGRQPSIHSAFTRKLIQQISSCALTILMLTPQLPARSQDAALPSTASRIERLNAAAASVDTDQPSFFGPQDIASLDAIKTLHKLAEAYSEIGEQGRAVASLERALVIAAAHSSKLDSYRTYPALVATTAYYYDSIGETMQAKGLLEEAIELTLTLTDESKGHALGDIAEAYTLIDNPDITPQGLLTILDLVTDTEGPVWEGEMPFVPSALLDGFIQLEDSVVAIAGLNRMLEMRRNEWDAELAEDRRDMYKINTLSLYSKAFSQHSSPERAKQLLDEAMALVRSQEDVIDIIYTTQRDLVSAYGHLNDTSVAKRGLAELIQLVGTTDLLTGVDGLTEDQRHSAFTAVYTKTDFLEQVALAYSNLGDLARAQDILASSTERLQKYAFSETVLLLSLGLVAQTYEAAGDIPGQQAVIQQIFDLFPAMEAKVLENEADYSSPTVAGLNTLLWGYSETAEDVIAQQRLHHLEALYKAARFDDKGFSGQLSNLATAALLRGDINDAHRLMLEATQLFGTPADRFTLENSDHFRGLGMEREKSEQIRQFRVLSQIAQNYGSLQNQQITDTGIEALNQAATRLRNPELRAEINDLIIQARAGIYIN